METVDRKSEKNNIKEDKESNECLSKADPDKEEENISSSEETGVRISDRVEALFNECSSNGEPNNFSNDSPLSLPHDIFGNSTEHFDKSNLTSSNSHITSASLPLDISYSTKNNENILEEHSSVKKHIIQCSTSESGSYFRCENCNFSTNLIAALVTHMYTHTVQNALMSEVGSSDNDDKHESTESNLYKCTYCDISFDRKRSLVRHLRIHPDGKKIKCPDCEYICADKSKLSSHMRTHTGEKPFRCKLCGYNTATKSNLVAHLRIHTGEKPFKCTHCDYVSMYRQNLSVHLRKHTGEKPFQCSICDFRSAHKNALTRHMFTHNAGPSPVLNNRVNHSQESR